MHTCQDYSDRVFRLNQTCNEAEYVQKYSQTVCSGDIYNGDPDDIKYCKDLDAIMKEHNTSDYWDPHQCINSCIDPGYGCQACTNPDYFKCTKDSQSVCIHPKLVCNHHPDCDNVEDEQLDNCYDIYVKNGLVDEFATLKCASKLYPNMETVATVCDGIEECHGGEDEPNTCKNSNGNIFLGVSVGTVIGVYLCLKLFTKIKERHRNREKIKFTWDIEIPIVDSIHSRKELEIFGLHVQKYFGNRTKRKVGLKMFAFEEKYNKTEADVYTSIHNNYEPEIGKMIINAKYPGIIERHFDLIVDISEYLSQYERVHSIRLLFRKLVSLVNHYSDTFKDSFLLYVMVEIN